MSFIINPYSFSSTPISVTISTTAVEPVEGVFEISIVFQQAVTGFVVGDITVAKATVENLHSDDNITWYANVIPDGTGDIDVSIAAGVVSPTNAASNTLNVTYSADLEFLTNPATSDLYYEFRELVGDNATAVLTTDPGIRDLSGNSRTLSLINSPTMSHLLVAADVATDTMASRTTGTMAFSTGVDGSTFLNRSFSFMAGVRSSDGRSTAAWFPCGNFDGTDYGFRFAILGSDSGAGQAGKIQLRYQSSIWVSTAQTFADNATGLHWIEAHYDFETDVLTVYYDGATVAGSFTSGSMAGLDPTAYACSANLYIGNHNNNGTAATLANTNQIVSFALTTLMTGVIRTAVLSYLQNRKATFELVDVISDATYLINPHDLIISSDGTKAYVSGKGDDSSSLQDGSFAIIDITDPTNLAVLGGYNSGTNDQIDGETVLELSATRVLHFVDDNCLLFNVSNPASPTKIRTVANGNGVVNGAVQIGNYVFGANKGGFIDVFDVSTIDSFTLVGSYNTDTDLGGDGPHDIDVCADGEHIIICSRPSSTYYFAIYKVMDAGSLISIASWSVLSRLSTASLSGANRCRVMQGTFGGKEIAVLSCDPNFAVIDITTKASPVIDDTFDMTTFASGLHQFRQRWTIPTWQVGLRLLNVTDPTNIIQDAGYYNDTTFTTGNASFHDIETFEVSGVSYVLVAAQSSSQIACFRINRV